VDVYPEGESSFVLYEDDGVSRDYLEGRYTLTTLRCSTVGDDVRVTAEPASAREMNVTIIHGNAG
jgi:alpha-glucosidase